MSGYVRAGELEVWTEQVGEGPDVLLIGGLGDTVDARFVEAPGVHLDQSGHPGLPTDPARNAASKLPGDIDVSASSCTRPSFGATLRISRM